jgi:hypothetical protein
LERFYRTDRARSREIGERDWLAIVKHLSGFTARSFRPVNIRQCFDFFIELPHIKK